MTTVPFMSTDASAFRIASTARPSAPILSPRPWSGAAARAPASVTRSSSSARLRSISWSNQHSLDMAPLAYPTMRIDSRPGRLAPGPLEELTPELPYPADRVRETLDDDRRLAGWRVDDDLVLARGNSLGMNPDDAMVDAALLDHERADRRVALETTRAGDLEAAHRDHIAAHEASDRHLHGPDVSLHVRLRSDEQVAVALDLAAEVAEQLAAALQLQPAGQRVIWAEHSRLLFDAIGVRTPIAPRYHLSLIH